MKPTGEPHLARVGVDFFANINIFGYFRFFIFSQIVFVFFRIDVTSRRYRYRYRRETLEGIAFSQLGSACIQGKIAFLFLWSDHFKTACQGREILPMALGEGASGGRQAAEGHRQALRLRRPLRRSSFRFSARRRGHPQAEIEKTHASASFFSSTEFSVVQRLILVLNVCLFFCRRVSRCC